MNTLSNEETSLIEMPPLTALPLYTHRVEVVWAPYLCGLLATVAEMETAATVTATLLAPTPSPLAL